MKASPVILCLDIGTSACKGALVDPAGFFVAQCRREYALMLDAVSGRAEQDPFVLWAAVRDVIASLADRPEFRERIAAISLTAQMCTHLLLDSDDRPLTPFLSWADRRAEPTSREMGEAFSENERAAEFGARLSLGPSWPIPRLKWWRDHQPALLDRARLLIQPKEWIIWNLTGLWLSDLSSLRGLRHQSSGAVSERFAQWAGFDPALAPSVADPAAVVGSLDDRLVSEWSLPKTTPVILGWNDFASALLGATGLPDRTVGFDITGTSEHLGFASASGEGLSPCLLQEIPLSDRCRLRYGVTSSSGRTLDWYWSRLRHRRTDGDGLRELENEVARTPAGAEELIFLPCIDGERAPWPDPAARGCFFGIRPDHTEAHFSRAVLEGVAFTLASIYRRLGRARPLDEFRVVGGGSALASWNQIKADILGVPFTTLDASEAGCLGAAILGAKALGWSRSVAEAAQAMIRPQRTFIPNRAGASLYARQHDRFERLYVALQPLFVSP